MEHVPGFPSIVAGLIIHFDAREHASSLLITDKGVSEVIPDGSQQPPG